MGSPLDDDRPAREKHLAHATNMLAAIIGIAVGATLPVWMAVIAVVAAAFIMGWYLDRAARSTGDPRDG